MLKPSTKDLTEEIRLLSLAQTQLTQPSKATGSITCDGQIRFKGLGGEDAACRRLMLNITSAHVSLTHIDKISTSCIFPEGTIFYTVSGTESEIAIFRRLVGRPKH